MIGIRESQGVKGLRSKLSPKEIEVSGLGPQAQLFECRAAGSAG